VANDQLQVTIEGKVYSLDDFELGELEWAEDQIGMALEEATPMKQAVVFVAVIKRRDNPDFTIHEARKLKMSVFDEPKANGNGNGKSRPTKAAKAAANAPIPAKSGETS
jgi:hypothetical protein